MKKLSLLLAALSIYSLSFGQVSSYNFSYTAGTYTPLVGGTALVPAGSGITGTGWFEQVFNVSMPFVYYFNGIGYSSVYVNSNGHLSFGKPTGTSNVRPHRVYDGQNGVIMGYGCNSVNTYTFGANVILLGGLVDNANAYPIMYGTIGTAPNRTFVVQWTNAIRCLTYFANGASPVYTENVTFQIRLKEGSNVAEIVYDGSSTNNTTVNPAVGLSGASTADYNLLTGAAWNTATNTTTTITSTVPFQSGVSIPAGTTYDFTPPVALMPTSCSGAPAPAAAVCNVGITCGPVSLGLSGLSLSTGLTYQWQSSKTGMANSWANISGATNPSYTGFIGASTYFQCLVACGAGTPVASSYVSVGYESSCPAMPYNGYNQHSGFPSDNIAQFQITGSCGSAMNDVNNSVSGFNFPGYGGSGGSDYSYVDYTWNSAFRVKLEASTSTTTNYTATINNFGNNAGVYGVWIDLNDNGSFLDANEYVGSIGTVSGAASSFTLTIPANNFGIHRMRVRGTWNAAYSVSTITPTGLLNYWGQANDYAVEIVPPTPAPTTSTPVCATGTLVLTSPTVSGSTIYTWAGPLSYSSTTSSITQNYTVPSTTASGTYSLTTTVSGANPCVAGTTVVVVKPQPSLTGTTNNGPVCAGDILNLSAGTASNVTSYAWTGPVAVTGAATASGSVPSTTTAATGTYSVAVTNGAGSGCTVTFTTAATVKVSPDVSLFSIPFATTPCQGAISTVTVNSTSLPAGSYQLTYDLSGTNTATGLTASITMSGTSGTFTTSALANAGATNLTITSITNSGLCSKALSTGNTIGITVNPLPSTITGTNSVCQLQTTNLSSSGAGTWTSGGSSIATAAGSGTSTGTITGVLAGTAAITYTLPTGCFITGSVTVKPIPAVITGTMTVCKGLTTQLSDATTPGAWTSNNSALATVVSGTGVVTGVLPGAPVITYTASNACYVVTTVTVNPLPANISANVPVCEGLTNMLSDATGAGSWTSGTSSVATVVSGSGLLTAVLAGTAAITYTLPTGCIATATATVNPLPTGILGTLSVCEGLTTALSDATTPGTWSSSNTFSATIVSGTGVLTGVLAGINPIITYTLPTGCIATATATVNPLPAAITGAGKVCEGLSMTLNSTTLSGSWTSGNSSVATVSNPTLGSVTGVLAGTANITYTLSTGCLTSMVATVNPLPAGITGTTGVCVGLNTSLSDITSLGTWSTSSVSLATVGSGTGVVSGVAAGAPTITYKLPTGCIATTVVTVNPLPAIISGPSQVCEGLNINLSDATGTGTWESSDPGKATVVSGTGVVTGVLAGTTLITYALSTGCISTVIVLVNPSPAGITGTSSVCLGLTTTLSNSVTGGVWSSSNTTLATIGTGSGVVTGIAAGSPVMTYKLPAGCIAIQVATVNPLPAAISGIKKVCEGYTVTLSNAATPGSWTSGTAGVASVVSGSGVVTGNLAGTAMITYTLGTGCIATTVMTVNPSPAPILGVMDVCKGLATPLSDAISGGAWSSSNTSSAIVSGTGVVSGLSPGTPVITYKLPAGCFETSVVTVNALPNVITGTMKVCEGLTTTLKDVTLLGSWTSGSLSNATVVSNTGVVTGVTAGTADITYALSTGCLAISNVTVNPTPAAITGASSVCSASNISMFDISAPGAWSSKSIAQVAVDPVTGIVKGINPGVANITYTLPEGCTAVKAVTVNALPVMYSVTGGGSFCTGDTGVHISLAGSDTGINYQIYYGTSPIFKVAGTGSMIDLGLFSTGGSYSAIAVNKYTSCSAVMPGSAPVTVIPAPAPITGPGAVCVASNISLGHPVSGGTWLSTDISAATIDISTGLVKGIATGTTLITYRIPAGCYTTTSLVVNPLPDAIVGDPTVCAGLTTTLSDDGTGTWTSGRSAIATIDPATGVMKGIFRGNCIITYTIPTGCFTFKTATVNPIPDAITGDNMVCVGATAYLSDAYAGGTWKSGNPSMATITTTGTLGTITGVAQGTAAVTYTLPTGCLISGAVTINAQPTVGAISGPLEVCQGKMIVLSDPTPGGVWTSKTGLTNVTDSGRVTGAVPGKDTILYSVTNVCSTVSAKWAFTVKQCDFTEVPTVSNGNTELKVFPNPNDGVFSVNLLSDLNEPVNIVITNMVGQKVKEVTTVTNSAVTMQMDIAAGVYLLTGYTAHGTYVAKVTVTR